MILGALVAARWRAIPDHYPEAGVDAFVVMPNHLHGIGVLSEARDGHARPLHVVIGSFKAAVARKAGRPVWQRSFHDRVIRNDAELEALRRYVGDNPYSGSTRSPSLIRPGSSTVAYTPKSIFLPSRRPR
jgi:putative transposase